MYRVTQLKNGLTVATAEMPHMASVSVGLWVGVGGRYEAAASSGICHFIEHMLFKGTRRRNAHEISQAVEGIGGYLNAFTSEEHTCFYARAGHDHLAGLYDVLTDMALHSRFDARDINKERDVIKEELAMYLDQPAVRVQEVLHETLWPDQPLGRPLTGSEKTLDAMNRAALVEYLRTHYVTGNTLVAAAGRVRHKDLVALSAKFGAKFNNGKRPVFTPALAEQKAPQLRLESRTTEQTQLALGVRVCSRHDERRYALRVLNVLLGENTSSRLFQVIREEQGLAYSVQSSITLFDDTGVLTISAGLDLEKMPHTLKLLMKEMRRLRDKSVSPGELRRAKDYLIGQMDLSLEGTESQMMWLGEQLLAYGRIFQANEIKHRIRDVTAAQVRAVAQDFFRPERLNLSLVSPLKSAAGLDKLLRL
ncbi:MAG: pitrilysin family protein [Verrucomicrobiota bacterium]